MPTITIGADGIDAKKLEEEILQAVAEKQKNGAYDDAAVARAERSNLMTMQDDENFVDRYMACLRQLVVVDIDDFEIIEHRARFAPLLKALKKTIWKLLKFYTFRLWSQQNQTNNVLLAGMESINRHHNRELARLEARIEALEKQLAATGKGNPA